LQDEQTGILLNEAFFQEPLEISNSGLIDFQFIKEESFREQKRTGAFAEAYNSNVAVGNVRKTPLMGKRIIYERKLVGPALRSLKRIQLPVSLLAYFLHMSGHVASPYTPLGSGIRENHAVFTGGEILDFLAAFTLLYNRMAFAAVELAAFVAHKKALQTLFYACTNHFNHTLSQ
jgi:hypothetical protein